MITNKDIGPLLILLAILIFTSFINTIEPVETEPISLSLTESEMLSYCNRTSLEPTCKCLNDFVKQIYNFTPRHDNEHSFEDILENGGDCNDYSNLYVKWGKELGYYAKTEKLIQPNTITRPDHVFAIIYDKGNQYCILDQRSFHFQRLNVIENINDIEIIDWH